MSYEKENLRKYLYDHYTALDEDKEINQKRKQKQEQRKKFDKLPEQAVMDFFCEECFLDFKAPAYKIWSNRYEIGMWQSLCPVCGRLISRNITESKDDIYYDYSEKVRRFRAEYEQDMLQPEDYGYRLLYGDAFASYYAGLQNREQEIEEKYLSMGLHGLTIREKTEKEKMNEFFKEEYNA